MIVAIQHQNQDDIQNDLYQNVASVIWEYQPTNGLSGSFWLKLRFKKGTNEAKEYKNGETYIEFETLYDQFQIYKENK